MPPGEWWALAGVCVGLVVFAGVASGLTLGLMSLDQVDMEVRPSAGGQVVVGLCARARARVCVRVLMLGGDGEGKQQWLYDQTKHPFIHPHHPKTQVLKRSGTEAEKRYAARIIPVIANEHFLLVTLLLCNAAATEVS